MDISFYSNSTSSYRPVIQLIHDIYTTHLRYEKEIGKLKSNVKATWKVLNETLNRNKRGLPSIFGGDSQEISCPKEMAKLFYKYFTNIGPNLASKIPVSEKSHTSFYVQK